MEVLVQKQKLNQYLQLTGVKEVIEQALKEISRQRPRDPIEFIGNYLQSKAHLYQNRGISQNVVALQYQGNLGYNANLQQKQNTMETDNSNDQILHYENDNQNEEYIEDIQNEFNDEDEITITTKPLVLLNQQRQVNKQQVMAMIEEVNVEESGSDYDEEIEPTQVPTAGVKKDTSQSQQAQSTTRAFTQDSQTTVTTLKGFGRKKIMLLNNSKILIESLIKSYLHEYEGKVDAISYRATRNQVVYINEEEKNENFLEEEMDQQQILKFLQQRSQRYKNTISIKELARGGEAIVYRIDHINLDEVILKCALHQIETRNDSLLDILAESQQLRLLKNEFYIAQVKEEIIEYNKTKNQIEKYYVIIERAQYTLQDLLQIWNDEEHSIRVKEQYTPEKLAFYFYQVLCIMQFLHQRNIYYGDMKPANLLVFRDQKVKVGDLGISIKINPEINADKPQYKLQGLTKSYQSQQIYQSYIKGEKLSKNQLFDADKYTIVRTFEKCLQSVQKIHGVKFSQQQNLAFKIQQYLINHTIEDSLIYWTEYFAKEDIFFQDLVNALIDERKQEAIAYVYQMTDYKFVITDVILNCYDSYKLQANRGSDEEDIYYFSKLDVLDIKFKKDTFKEAPPLDNNSQNELIKEMKKDIRWKQILYDLANIWQYEKNYEQKPLFDSELLFNAFDVYFSIDFLYGPQLQYLIDSCLQEGFKVFENDNLKHEYLEFCNQIKNQLADFQLFLNWNFIANRNKVFWDKIVIILRIMEESSLFRQDFIIKFMILASHCCTKYEKNQDTSDVKIQIRAMQEQLKEASKVSPELEVICCKELISLYIGQEDPQSMKAALDLAEKTFNQLIEQDKYNFEAIDFAILYAQLLNYYGDYDQAMVIAEWLNYWKEFLGEGNPKTLLLYGVMGEAIISKELDEEVALNLLYKYSLESAKSLIHYLDVLFEKYNPPQYNDKNTKLLEGISRFQINHKIKDESWQFILKVVYLIEKDDGKRFLEIFSVQDSDQIAEFAYENPHIYKIMCYYLLGVQFRLVPSLANKQDKCNFIKQQIKTKLEKEFRPYDVMYQYRKGNKEAAAIVNEAFQSYGMEEEEPLDDDAGYYHNMNELEDFMVDRD